MGRVHYFVVLLLVLYYPLRVKPGPIKEGDVTSEITSDTADPFNVVDMINFYRSSSVSAKRKIQRAKANAPERFDDESSCSESESSDDDYEESEYSDDVPDGNSDWDDDSPLHPSDIADDSGSERCCTPPGSQTQYSDESD